MYKYHCIYRNDAFYNFETQSDSYKLLILYLKVGTQKQAVIEFVKFITEKVLKTEYKELHGLWEIV